MPTYEFAFTDERSWQARYDYDFAALGVPGLTSTVRYITGNNVDTGKGFEGKDRERDLDIGYVLQSGSLKGLGIRVRNVMARSNYRSDIDEKPPDPQLHLEAVMNQGDHRSVVQSPMTSYVTRWVWP